MKHDGFAYTFTPKELWFFLFGKKECPWCHSKMERRKSFTTVPGHTLNTRQDAFFRSNAKVKAYHYVYYCPSCSISYPLEDMANKRW